VLARLQEDINHRPRELGAAIEYLRREYTGIAADQSALLQGLVTRVVRRLESVGPDLSDGIDLTAMPAHASGKKGGIFGWLKGGSREGK